MGKVIIFSAPSGSGKSTIIGDLLEHFEELEFSISATSREPRGQEKNGVHYYFFTPEKFRSMIADDALLEWEEVYQGTYYGTLRSEIERIWKLNHVIIFDVDVLGGMSLKKIFGDKALSIFIMPPSVEELRRRLICRGTETAQTIEKRVGKAEYELSFADQFDRVVVNDDLKLACQTVESVVSEFIKADI